MCIIRICVSLIAIRSFSPASGSLPKVGRLVPQVPPQVRPSSYSAPTPSKEVRVLELLYEILEVGSPLPPLRGATAFAYVQMWAHTQEKNARSQRSLRGRSLCPDWSRSKLRFGLRSISQQVE